MNEQAFSAKPTVVIGWSLWEFSSYGKTDMLTRCGWSQVGQFTKSRGTQFFGRESRSLSRPIKEIFPGQKCQPRIFVGNGFGKLAEWLKSQNSGIFEVNHLRRKHAQRCGQEFEGMRSATRLGQQGNEHIQSVNALVGETNDGYPQWYREGCIFPRRKWLRPSNRAKSGWCRKVMFGAGSRHGLLWLEGGIGTASAQS